MPSELREQVGAALDGELARFFPAAVDAVEGGFHSNFDAAWGRLPSGGKLCVYQARMTWVAATVARRRPERHEAYLRYARHGVECLLGVFADRVGGGYGWRVPADATVQGADRKLLYNHAFVLYALSAAARSTEDGPTLAAAVEAFDWLERVLHDGVHGGYAEAAHHDGRLVGVDDAASDTSIGTPPGHKSINAQIHALEALVELHRAWPAARVAARIDELIGLIAVRLPDDRGFLPAAYRADWTPLDGWVSYGHDVETAFLLADAAGVLGRPDDPAVWSLARRTWDNTLQYGTDHDHGGLFDVGHPGRPAASTKKVWWVQAEAVQSLLMMHERFGNDDDRYLRAFEQCWAFARKFLIDPAGGWRGEVSADGRTVLSDAKAHDWKACYHTARAMLNVADMLGRSTAPDSFGPAFPGR